MPSLQTLMGRVLDVPDSVRMGETLAARNGSSCDPRRRWHNMSQTGAGVTPELDLDLLHKDPPPRPYTQTRPSIALSESWNLVSFAHFSYWRGSTANQWLQWVQLTQPRSFPALASKDAVGNQLSRWSCPACSARPAMTTVVGATLLPLGGHG